MRLTTLQLRRFRNHLDSFFELGDSTNVLLGGNGQGKTNVIEAISYLCITKSFYASNDSLSVTIGEDIFEVEGSLTADSGSDYHVRVAYDRATREKSYSINRIGIEPMSSVVGRFPVVISSPEHIPITMGGPSERRRFVDFVVSQSSPIYFQNLLEYRQVLRQRNKILLDAKLSRRDPQSIIEPWDEQLIRYGSFLMARRKQFVDEFRPFIISAYRELVGEGEVPDFTYRSMTALEQAADEEEIQELLRADLRVKNNEEKRIGSTLVGPHRDEFILTINGLELRKFASQGQHKTFLNALKIGEFFYLRDRCRETPIMLLDDVFSELDERRSKRLLIFLETLSQTVITSTNIDLFDHGRHLSGKNKVFHIQSGAVVRQESFAV